MRALRVAVLAAVAACGTRPAPAPAPGPADALDGMVRWREGAVRDYTVQLTVSCMCVHRGSYLVTVQDGRMADAVSSDTRQPADERVRSLLPTVDALYQQIADAMLAGSPVRVQLDPALSYPADVVIGTPENDAGVTYTLRDLRPRGR
jgi:hypothetical protein